MTIAETANSKQPLQAAADAAQLKRKVTAGDAESTVSHETSEADKRHKIDETVTAAAAEEDDAASIYPDSEEFYAWLVTGSEAGDFLASHRLKSVVDALPACKRLVDLGVESVYDPADDAEEEADTDNDKSAAVTEKADVASKTEKEPSNDEKAKLDEIDDLKDSVNFAIEDSYCITLVDFVASETVKKETAASVALRQRLSECGSNKTWIKLSISREAPTSESAACVPITVSVFDARKGHIIPKIMSWKWLTSVEAAETEMDAGIKAMVEKYL
ncbi:hypothetical protein BJ741DRAFT_615259 [Chytriomyces cf. hyalinus JEL632]|nr:hypothetical protein BJ741DRAFT_615259 [Chytriomyces cf. hyalinus JEL632]